MLVFGVRAFWGREHSEGERDDTEAVCELILQQEIARKDRQMVRESWATPPLAGTHIARKDRHIVRKGIVALPSPEAFAAMPSETAVWVQWNNGKAEWVERALIDFA
jgi:hypothetical protein